MKHLDALIIGSLCIACSSSTTGAPAAARDSDDSDKGSSTPAKEDDSPNEDKDDKDDSAKDAGEAPPKSGTLVTTFGTQGILKTEGPAIAFLPDGTTYAASGSYGTIKVARFLPTGAADPTYGTGGEMIVDKLLQTFADPQWEADITVLPDGRALTLGVTHDSSVGTHTFLLRSSAKGIVDSTYGTGGLGHISYGNADTTACDEFAVESSGAATLVCRHTDGYALARVTAAGKLDQGFGGAGFLKRASGFSAHPTETHLVRQSDGKWIVLASTTNQTPSSFRLDRFLTNGQPDASFGISGSKASVAAQSTTGYALDDTRVVALQADGKILTVGNVGGKPTVTRYLTNATVDATFGKAGYASFGVEYDLGTSLAVQPDGKILVGVYRFSKNTDGESMTQPVVVRLNKTGSVDTTFGTDGSCGILPPNKAGGASVRKMAPLSGGQLAIAVGGLIDGERAGRVVHLWQ